MPLIIGLAIYGAFRGLLRSAEWANNYLAEELQKVYLKSLEKPGHELFSMPLYVDSAQLKAKVADAANAPFDTLEGVKAHCELSAVILQGAADYDRTS
jgi:hypothetical protein